MAIVQRHWEARCCCFYGWWILALLVLSMCAAHSGSMLLNSLTIAEMMDEFAGEGVSNSQFSVMWLIGTGGAGVGSLYYGRLVDIYGARVMMPTALLILSLSITAMANTGAREALPTWGLPFAFFGIRSATLGAIFPWVSTVIGQWFNRRRGTAVGMKGFGTEFGVNLCMAPPVQWLIDSYGWRLANTTLALFACTVALPLAVFMRHTPEQVGLRPDGDLRTPRARDHSEEKTLLRKEAVRTENLSNAEDDRAGDARLHEANEETYDDEEEQNSDETFSFTRQEALRTIPVYILGIDIFFAAVIGAGTVQVLKQVLRENDANEVSVAKHVMIPNGIAQALLPFVAGWMRDTLRVPLKYIIALSSLLIASAPFVATFIQGEHQIALAVLFGANFGSVWGLKGSVSSVIYADYYGRRHLGKIQAIDAMMGLAGTALGPLIITFSREQLGSYRPIFYILSALPCGMAIVALVFLAKPAPPESAGSMYGKP